MTNLPPMLTARHIPLPGGGWLNVHEQAGNGPTLLFLHGFTDCAESFRLLLPHLAGRHLVIPDLRGHGGSFRGPIDSLSTLAQDVEAIAADLDLNRLVVVGHSMGALVAVTLAARGKIDAAGLVTVSGSLKPGGPVLHALREQFAALPSPLSADHPFLDEWYACSRPVPSEFMACLRASCTDMRREDWLACLDLLDQADLRDAARNLTIPSLALSGNIDDIFPTAHQRELIAALRPNQNVIFRAVGHNPHWEVPDQVAAVISENLFVI